MRCDRLGAPNLYLHSGPGHGSSHCAVGQRDRAAIGEQAAAGGGGRCVAADCAGGQRGRGAVSRVHAAASFGGGIAADGAVGER